MTWRSLAIALAIAPCIALAEEPAPQPPPATYPAQPVGDWQLALRGAYALPYGSSTSTPGDDLSQVVSGELPLAVEVNYRLSDAWYVGGAIQYGFARLSNTLSRACTGGSCSVHTLRLAANAFHHLGPPRTFHGWLGAGLGYEQVGLDATGSGGSGSVTISGFELSLQAGLDYPLSSVASVGPFVSASLGEFTQGEVNGTSRDISNTATHGWFTFGLRLALGT